MALSFAILGDSIAYGQGAARPDDTIAGRLAARLGAVGIPTHVQMFAVPGARSADLAAQVRRATPGRPDLALIIIGANDLTRLVPPSQAAAHLSDAVRTLRAGGAEVILAPAPDLSVVPWVPIAMRSTVRAGSVLLQEAQIRAARAAGARIADGGMTTATGFATDPALFSADRFHPSSAGYALIADALAPTVQAAAAYLHARHAPEKAI